MIEAVRQNGNALQYASQELTRDREVVMEAVRQNGSTSRTSHDVLCLGSRV